MTEQSDVPADLAPMLERRRIEAEILSHVYETVKAASGVAEARRPYVPGSDLETVASGDSSADFVRLKHLLAHLGCSVPTLYKQYTEVAEPGGVRFLDFGVDPEFSHCVDGLVLVDVQQLKAQRRERYIGSAGTAGALTAA